MILLRHQNGRSDKQWYKKRDRWNDDEEDSLFCEKLSNFRLVSCEASLIKPDIQGCGNNLDEVITPILESVST